MSVHYKFKSAIEYDTVTFDGLHISVGDLKAAISQQKRIGKTSDFDLQITNAQTKEVYIDDNALIPKNTSLLVARVPLSQQPKKQWEGTNSQSSLNKDVAINKGVADLSRMEGSEQDKINAMISQSTFDYDPSNYQKIRGQNQKGAVPPNYICYKCQNRGHWIKDCPTATSTTEKVEIRRSTGIPRSFMVPVDGPKAPGAMMTPSGTYAVPAVDHEAYMASEREIGVGGARAPETAAVPDELICSLCRDLLTDAVMIPCCGNSFCDECIRGVLLESEDHECPDCREKEIAPTTLIPNRFLRNSVSSFRNQTGYSRRMPHRQSNPPPKPQPPQPEPAAPAVVPINQAPPTGDAGVESDTSDDNITVTVPPAAALRPRPSAPHHRAPRYGPPVTMKPPVDGPGTVPVNINRIDEQRASTPTVDERRDPMAAQAVYNRGPQPPMAGGLLPVQRFNNPPYGPGPLGPPLPGPGPRGPPMSGPGPRGPPMTGPGPRGPPMSGPGPRGPPFERFPPDPYQPPPPGIKDSPTNGSEDPIEAFNRMIREKEMRAQRREEERRRAQSGSRSPSRSRSRSRSPPPRPRSPSPRRSPPPREPRPRPRSPSEPRPRPRTPRYSRSRSISRGRIRRSPPWSPRRRRTRERSLSLTRSPSPRRRHRSPLRYRSPLRSPPRSPLRLPPRSPLRSPPRSPLRSPPRSPLRSPRHGRSPRPASPHRYAGMYDELLSPPSHRVDRPYGPRYGGRNNAPPPGYPPMGPKPIPPLISIQTEPPLNYRGRYDPPPFQDVPPGVEPTVPGFEPSPFEKPPFGPPGPIERDRLPPPGYREPFRAPFVDGAGPGYRDLPPQSVPSEIPVHVGEQPGFRDNFRPGHVYREPAPLFRDGHPYREPGVQPPPYRDGPPNRDFRGGPPQYRDGSYRNHNSYREGGFRENVPHNFREGGPPFRPPSTDPREPVPANYHDPNFRDGYRDESGRYRPNHRGRGGSRRNPVEQERHRDARDRERYNEGREPSDRSRDDKRGYEKVRDERPRDYERSREYEKDRERDREYERPSPEKKIRAPRDKKRSESRGRSRERESRKDKKEDRGREKNSADRSRERKEKDKKEKIKDKKKKKREKEKEGEKKKKRDKKEKKDKEIKKEDDDLVKSDDKEENKDTGEIGVETQEPIENHESFTVKKEASPLLEKEPEEEAMKNDLYADEPSDAVDKEIIENYVKTEETNGDELNKSNESGKNKEEPFDGIELQVTADELDLKAEIDDAVKNPEMLAPLPALSKWEVDEDNAEKTREPGEITSPDEEEDSGKVTSEVLKRAENAIFAKAITSLRPIEIKKISGDRAKLYTDESQPKSSIQITVPLTESDQRSIEINEKKKSYSKTPPPRLSVKERLGSKVEDVRRPREPRVVHSTVERVKSRSKTPKKEQQPYRRVTVEKDRNRKPDHIRVEYSKNYKREASGESKHDKKRDHSKIKDEGKHHKDEKKSQNENNQHSRSSATAVEKKNIVDRERKKSVLDEANFEPDYDENVESETEAKDDDSKKRERSTSPPGVSEPKKAKIENETIKLDLTNVKKKKETDSESSSSDDTSSSSSSDVRKHKKKKKRSKKKKKRAASDSDSDSGSSSDDHKKKKKKRKHKKKSSKKKKKSKTK